MIKIDNQDITEQTLLIEKSYLEGLSEPLYYDKFINKVATNHAKSHIFVPRVIRMAKSASHLLKKDLSPQVEINISEPIFGSDGTPMWMGTTEKEITLWGFGYKNGDSRYPSDISFSDKNPHGYLVGVTGHGKSVTLNAVLFALMRYYPPWELRIIMSDAKVAEFKRYADGYVPPHITSIAATTDSDYIISVFDTTYEEMKLLNAALGSNGETNIEDFRKNKKLVIPRTLIVSDEVQAMMLDAGKKTDKIVEKINLITKLGRNTGFHLLLCSQEVDSNVKKALPNMSMRASLGADANVSTEILGNDEAKINYGKRGRLIVNLDSANGKKESNIHFRVPFQTPKSFLREKEELTLMGEKYNYSQPLSFYDGESYPMEEEYVKMLEEERPNINKIVLGEPSFVLPKNSTSKKLTIEFNSESTENILLFGGTPEGVERLGKMLMYNLDSVKGKVISHVFSSNKPISDKIGFGNYHTSVNIKQWADPKITRMVESVYLRKMYVECDSLAFSGEEYTGRGNELLSILCEDDPELNTSLNLIRANVIIHLAETPQYARIFNLSGDRSKPKTPEETDSKILGIMRTVLTVYKRMGFHDKKFTLMDLTPYYVWIIGIDKMLGLGTDQTDAAFGTLKGMLQDSESSRTRFICTMVNSENLSRLSSGFRYTLMEGMSDELSSKMGVRGFPGKVGSILSVLYDKNSKDMSCVKFKKMAFDGEFLS